MDVLAVLRMCGWQGTGFLMRMPILFWFRDVAFFIRSAVAIILLMETGDDFLPIVFCGRTG